MKEVIFFEINNKYTVKDWLYSLSSVDKAKIIKRLVRIEDYEHFGDYKNLGDGVYELRFFFGSGYRIYFGIDGDKIVLLLTAGDKSTQTKDIRTAKEYWRLYNGQ